MDLLGKEVRDKITGFKGIATSKHSYLTGCDQYGVQPPVGSDGKVPDSSWFDVGRLEVIGKGITAEEVSSDKNGCDFRERPNK